MFKFRLVTVGISGIFHILVVGDSLCMLQGLVALQGSVRVGVCVVPGIDLRVVRYEIAVVLVGEVGMLFFDDRSAYFLFSSFVCEGAGRSQFALP